jgi:hypothetical protein
MKDLQMTKTTLNTSVKYIDERHEAFALSVCLNRPWAWRGF